MKEYRRDEETHALLNTDIQGLTAYKARREKMRKIDALEADINMLKTDLVEIKSLLTQLLNRG